MNGHDDHAEESVGPETPVSEYTLLAGSPRPTGGDGAAAATTTAEKTQQQQSAASPSLSESNGAFALKSPFAKKRRDDEEEEKKSAADGEGDIDDTHLLGRDFEREMVDVLILDSPKQSTMLKQNSQLDQIQEARASHEENGNAGDGEENEKGSGDQGNYVRAHSQEDGDDDDEEEEEEAYRYVYLNSPEENAALAYCSNTVVTSRFTIYNFIPKLLFYEFSKLANAYFLVISVMQTVKPISNTGGFPASLPALTIIVLIDMFFACLEDYKRHKADHTANELPCLRFSLEKRAFEQAKWHHLLVGDVVKLHNREAVPADLVILAACEPEPENPAGICYVETKSLDGETNLKLRQGVEATYTTVLSDEQVADIAGVVVCETPNNSIHRFNGTISLKNGKKEAITTNSVVLRGSTLRNTEYIYGLVVNTGPDTKIMMASSNTPMKWSNMERRLNQQILYICALMIALCLTGAIASSVWNHSNLSSKEGEKAWYLYDRQTTAVKAPVGNFFIQVLYYFLLLNSFIPVSLYVSMTSVKFMQAYFMNNDLEMYHEESDTPFQVRTMSLNEELGQIDYIFSDKTGTLTCNIMEFRKCSINGVAYGMGETEVGIAAKKRRQAEQDGLVILEEREDERKSDPKNRHREVRAPFVNYQDDAIFDALSREGSKQAATINSFFEHLGICHTVMPEKAPDGSLRLSASSPDEQALVAAAACFGYKFVARSPGKAMVEYFSCLADQDSASSAQPDKNNQVNAYQVLEVLEFNSTRKRMSVIAKMPNGKLKLLCKGADTVMYERLRETTDSRMLQMRNKTLQDMEMFASEGLRTLVIAEADVNEKFFEGWVVRYRTAINDMRQIELRRLGEKNDIDRLMEEIEVNLEILGATAIEDRLQAEVPDTIHKLRQASIKIWMLTGDKEETAINIGFACRLLTPDVERVVISADTHPDLASIMEELERYSTLRANTDDENDLSNSGEDKHVGRRYRDSTETPTTATESDDHRPLTRIESIAHINSSQEELGLVIDGETLEVALEECPELLLSVAEKCVAVIACRVSPAQKAQLVHLVRDNNPAVRTLAIGDGANDVSMIQAAHVGVGISGQEGMQAANSSDYAIAQFRFLSRLLLVHGRWNYVRMGKLILYIFYKNVMMNLTQFWYMIFTGFSGQKFFLEWGLQGYNLLFTALPIVLISTFEQDVPANLAHNYPVLYRIGQENSHFNTKIVWAWITSCIWESLIISFGTLYGMRYLSENGDTPTMWVYGCTAFTIVLLVVTLKLCLHQQMWWPIHLAIYMCSASLWVVTAAVISNGNSVSSAYWNGVFSNSFGVQVFWLLVPLLTIAALSRDFLWKGYIRAFQPSYKHLAQEVHAFKLDRFADKLLAFPPAEKIPTEDMESHFEQQPPSAGAARRTSISEALKYAVAAGSGSAHMLPVRPIAARQGVRRSVARGSAFSYDAESVMVESFMATERYNNLEHPQEARTLFERHASRGSMAFHGLPDSEAVAHALNAIDGGAPAPRGRERLHSTGNIFRGARHSFARRRLTATTLNATGANGSGSGSSFTGGNRNSMTTLTPRDDGLSPGYAYHRGLSIGGADDGLGTPHSGGETTPNHQQQQQQQRPPVHLVRRYTMPKFNRQQSMYWLSLSTRRILADTGASTHAPTATCASASASAAAPTSAATEALTAAAATGAEAASSCVSRRSAATGAQTAASSRALRCSAATPTAPTEASTATAAAKAAGAAHTPAERSRPAAGAAAQAATAARSSAATGAWRSSTTATAEWQRAATSATTTASERRRATTATESWRARA